MHASAGLSTIAGVSPHKIPYSGLEKGNSVCSDAQLAGIGCFLTTVSGRVLVETVRPDGGAAASGNVKPGDFLVAVDGIYVKSESHAKQLIIGSIGTPLQANLDRNGESIMVTVWRGADFPVIPDDCKILAQILAGIGELKCIKKFVEKQENDSALLSICRYTIPKLVKHFGIPEIKAGNFLEKCHLLSSRAEPSHERWLKACLMLRACGRGVRPFVAEVMKKLHERVITEVNDTFKRYNIIVDDAALKQKIATSTDSFDFRPVEMQLDSFEKTGAVTTNIPHFCSGTEPFLLSEKNSLGVFQNEARVLKSKNLVMIPWGSKHSLLMLEAFNSINMCLEPFQVCRKSDGSCFTAVYYRCYVGSAHSLVNQYFNSKPLPLVTEVNPRDDRRELAFWTVTLSCNSQYESSDHSLRHGDFVTFSGKKLPADISSDTQYVILNSKGSFKSFDIGTVLLPIEGFTVSKRGPAAGQNITICRIMGPTPDIPKLSIALFRDAAYRYHAKGREADLESRWKGVLIESIPSDFGEFSKLFCSTTQRKFKIFQPHQDHSPELLLNMIQFCKAFEAETFCHLFGVSSSQYKQYRSVLCNIRTAAVGAGGDGGVKQIRNKICHGDFYGVDEACFESLKACSENLLKNVRDLTELFKNQAGTATKNIEAWDLVAHESILNHKEIFVDEYRYDTPRFCILSREVAIALTPSEKSHFNFTIRQYEIERQEMLEEIQKQVVDCKSARSEVQQMKLQLRYEHLPVMMKGAIDPQISRQAGIRGGQSTVYRIKYWGQDLVAKIFHNHSRSIWKRELTSLTVLLHKNIVQVKYVVYETDASGDNREPIGYVMEKMSCSLLEYSQKLNCSQNTSEQFQQLLPKFCEVALALAFTHSHRIAHLDVKPENILLDDNNTSKLSDFGCAHSIQSTLQSTLSTRGTHFFMAPEIVPEKGSSWDPFCADVYSFGVTMYVLLHPNATVLERSTCNWDCQGLSYIPSTFADFGKKCTDHDPNVRPQMDEVYKTLCKGFYDPKCHSVLLGLEAALDVSLYESFKPANPALGPDFDFGVVATAAVDHAQVLQSLHVLVRPTQMLKYFL
jgi:hypothetical protein